MLRGKGIGGLGFLLLLLGVFASIRLGAVTLDGKMTWLALLGEADEQTRLIVRELRLPRALMALLAGGVLASAGVICQAILRNPMAAPSLIGISSGAGFAAALAIVLPLPLWNLIPLMWKLPLAAFLGSLASAFLVFGLAKGSGRTDTGILLLAGLAINSLAGAGTGLLTFLADDPQLRNISFWNLGSVAGADWTQVGVLFLFSLPLIASLFLSGHTLNAWMLGEGEAQLLGVPIERQKRLQLFIVSLAVGAAVSFTGVIGFVGLVVPHLLRLALGSDHRSLLPQSFLWGAVLLLSSDLIARLIALPLELPIGIVTALIGSPYFIYLLRREFRRIQSYDSL